MGAPGAAVVSYMARGRAARALAAAATALLVGAALALAQTSAGTPPIAPDLKAAMAAADAGSAADILKLADSGRADAQYYVGFMLLFGHPAVTKDPAKGCAYEQKASATRADAMHLVGECYRRGVNGPPDPEKAKAAFARAAEMGYAKSKCALGQMLMAEPGQGGRGLALCKEAGDAGDAAAQVAVADAYFQGGPTPQDHREARKWYEKAAQQNDAQAARKLGEMYAAGDGGKRDTKKALEWWRKAEAAGDPLSSILVADQLFSDLTGGRKPGPGTFAFKGGVPVEDIEVVESWYKQALERDPRPDVKKRAEYAIYVLDRFKTAGQAAAEAR
jgi:TPR repeat protein